MVLLANQYPIGNVGIVKRSALPIPYLGHGINWAHIFWCWVVILRKHSVGIDSGQSYRVNLMVNMGTGGTMSSGFPRPLSKENHEKVTR